MVEITRAGRLLVTERSGKILSFPKTADVQAAELAANLLAFLMHEP